MYPNELNKDSDVNWLSGFNNRIALIAGLIIDDKIKEPEITIPVWKIAKAVFSSSILYIFFIENEMILNNKNKELMPIENANKNWIILIVFIIWICLIIIWI